MQELGLTGELLAPLHLLALPQAGTEKLRRRAQPKTERLSPALGWGAELGLCPRALKGSAQGELRQGPPQGCSSDFRALAACLQPQGPLQAGKLAAEREWLQASLLGREAAPLRQAQKPKEALAIALKAYWPPASLYFPSQTPLQRAPA